MDFWDSGKLPACHFEINKELGCLAMTWTEYATSKQFREACNLTLQLSIQHSISSFLMDTTNLPMVGADDQQWVRSKECYIRS
jgi:hypothetical protein